MKKYLLVLSLDVADEGDVGCIEVLTSEQLDKIKRVTTGFGNMDGETYGFDKADAVEITDEEIKVLEKFGLTSLSFGYCDLDCDD